MSWKTALHNYVHAKNQADLELSVEPVATAVADHAYLLRWQSMFNNLLQVNRDRGVRSVRNETALRILGVKETNDRVIADIQLRRAFQYRIRETEHREERIEEERVTLDPSGGKWQVNRIVPLTAERSQSHMSNELTSADLDFGRPYHSPSMPYINYSILNNGEASSRKTVYNRARVAQYADTWWNSINPRYLEFEVDCTNFASQCLFAGGAPMDYTGKRASGWWYAGKKGGQELWSFSWAVAHSLQTHTASSHKGLRGTIVTSPQQLDIGDMISYDWDGDGRYQHNAIVTAKDANGMPLVNAHTYNSKHRYWQYLDSPAWTQRTRYVFVHIADEM
jgi:hypothetical protein